MATDNEIRAYILLALGSVFLNGDDVTTAAIVAVFDPLTLRNRPLVRALVRQHVDGEIAANTRLADIRDAT